MSCKHKKIKVLAIPSDRTFATSWYRIAPFHKLDAEIVSPTGGQFSWEDLVNIDILIVQRPATQNEVHWIETAKKYNKPVLLDYDDDPTCLNPDNPVYDIWNRDDKQACVKEAIKLADITMVSTQALKESLKELVPSADIRVVTNAIDDDLFDLTPSDHERDNIILMRGGSSHGNDWKDYKNQIIKFLKMNPDWKLAVMGFHPPWMKEIPEEQMLTFEFTDIPTYFDTLMQIKPKIMLVPLQDNKFNRAKSAIGAYEGSVAGAVVLASSLPEFVKSKAIDINLLPFISSFFLQIDYEKQLGVVPRLSQVNELRKDILEELQKKKRKYKPYTLKLESATDKEFVEYAQSHGHTQDFKPYQEAHQHLVEQLIKLVNPKTVVEYGCGPGGTLIEFLKRNVVATGLELNPEFVKYFKENYPIYENQIHCLDFTKEPIESVDEPCDLGISIEVFEHIAMPEEWWNQFILSLSKTYRHFYFTSTPYRNTKAFEEFWGHVNVRRTSSWIKLFEDNGFKFLSNPKMIVNWDLLFESKNIPKLV